MLRRFLHRPEDDLKLAAGDSLPAIPGHKPLYTIWLAWPRLTTIDDGYAYQNERFHTEVWQRAAKELGWLKTGRPANEQIVVYYACFDGDWVRFKMPNIPGSPLARTWIERYRGQWSNHVTLPNARCPGCGLEYFGQAGQADHLCTVCFWKGYADPSLSLDNS